MKRSVAYLNRPVGPDRKLCEILAEGITRKEGEIREIDKMIAEWEREKAKLEGSIAIFRHTIKALNPTRS